MADSLVECATVDSFDNVGNNLVMVCMICLIT